MLVFVPLALLQLLSVSGELVEEVVDDVCLEDLNPEGVGQLLSISFDLHVEREDRRVSVIKRSRSNSSIKVT